MPWRGGLLPPAPAAAERFSMKLSEKILWAIWGGLILTISAIVAASVASSSKARPLPIYGALPAFQLTDQNNRTTTLDTLRGHICIADVIFTRCAGQCLIMSAHMKDLQSALPPGSPIKLVSFTTDPAFDTPAVLKKYAGRYDAQDNQWIFLTGDKAALRRGRGRPEIDRPGQDAWRTGKRRRSLHPQRQIRADRQERACAGLLRRRNFGGRRPGPRRRPIPGPRVRTRSDRP